MKGRGSGGSKVGLGGADSSSGIVDEYQSSLGGAELLLLGDLRLGRGTNQEMRLFSSI